MTDFLHPMKYYALRYLLMWEQTERAIAEQFATTTTSDALRQGMHHFRIARSFAGIGDGSRLALVLQALQQACLPDAANNTHALARQFERDFGSFNLSAASKLLWLQHRSPYLIYDTQAVLSLKKMGHRLPARDYAAYMDAWRMAYERYRQDIDKAAESLIDLQAFVSHVHPTVESLRELVLHPWFKERVFDMALWENGNQH